MKKNAKYFQYISFVPYAARTYNKLIYDDVQSSDMQSKVEWNVHGTSVT